MQSKCRQVSASVDVMRHVKRLWRPLKCKPLGSGGTAESHLRVVPFGRAPRVHRPPDSSATANSTPLWNARVDRLRNNHAEISTGWSKLMSAV